MKAHVLLGAVAGAVIGAVIWAAVTAGTGYEVGYVAWGVGILVGMGAKLLGGEGVPTGIACAVLALLSIFSGKMVAAHYIVRGEIVDSMQDMFTQQDYDVAMREAEDFALLESEAEYPAL